MRKNVKFGSEKQTQKKGQGWYNEPNRHSLASRGVKSGRKQYSKAQKVPYKKIHSIKIQDDNTIEEKTEEIKEEKKDEDKPEEKEDEPEEKADKPEEEPKPPAVKKGILIDTYEDSDNE